jgi:heme exporter protein D
MTIFGYYCLALALCPITINTRCLKPVRFHKFFLDELRAEQERNKMLQEDMEATLQDIQNM